MIERLLFLRILQQLFGNIFDFNRLLFTIPVLLLAFPIHESAHGFVAYLLGDRTAKDAGRLTLNPIKHLDLLGTILILTLGLGWAKPVPVDPRNFKNRKVGMALTALAGPVSNLLMAFIALLALSGANVLFHGKYIFDGSFSIAEFVVYFASINIGLAIFNLIPINPLDGSRVLALILPQELEFALYRYESYIMVGFFIFLYFVPRFGQGISYLSGQVLNAFVSVVGLRVA